MYTSLSSSQNHLLTFLLFNKIKYYFKVFFILNLIFFFLLLLNNIFLYCYTNLSFHSFSKKTKKEKVKIIFLKYLNNT